MKRCIFNSQNVIKKQYIISMAALVFSNVVNRIKIKYQINRFYFKNQLSRISIFFRKKKYDVNIITLDQKFRSLKKERISN